MDIEYRIFIPHHRQTNAVPTNHGQQQCVRQTWAHLLLTPVTEAMGRFTSYLHFCFITFIACVFVVRYAIGWLAFGTMIFATATHHQAWAATTNASSAVPSIPFGHYAIRNWSVREGLPQISVHSISQDPHGYLWLATERGLARFDGHNFRRFDHNDSALLQNPMIKRVLATQDGSVWLITNSQLLRYQDGNFVAISLPADDDSHVHDMVELPDGRLVIAARHLYQFTHNQLQRLATLPHPAVKIAWQKQQLWIATQRQLGVLQQGQFKTVLKQYPNSSWQIQHLLSYHDQLLIGTNQGLFQLDPSPPNATQAAAQDYSVSWYAMGQAYFAEPVSMLLQDSRQQLWIASADSLWRTAAGQVIDMIRRYDVMPQQKVSAIPWIISGFVDRDQQLWFGSQVAGLFRFRVESTQLFGANAGLEDAFVWSVGEAEQQLLVGTNKGLYHYEPDKSLLTALPLASSHLNTSADASAVYSQFYDRERQQLWLGGRNGIRIYHWPSLQLAFELPQLQHSQINHISQGDDASIWLATEHGVYQWQQQRLVRIPLGHNHAVRFVLHASDGSRWIGTERGLQHWRQGQFVPIADPTLQQAFITFLQQGADGRIVVGTLQHGIAISPLATSQSQLMNWRWLNSDNGLPSNSVTFITTIAEGIVVAGMEGIYLLPPHSFSDLKAVQSHVIIDDQGLDAGLDGPRCCNGAGGSKGISTERFSLFPTIDGLLRLDHQLIQAQPQPLQPVLEYLQTPAQRYVLIPSTREPSQRDRKVILPPSQRDWQFSFSAPRFFRPNALAFRYQLVGYDQDWRQSTERDARYTNLPAGDYQFMLQVRSKEDLAWSPTQQVHIILKPYWYETWWLKALILLLSFVLLRWYIQWRAAKLMAAKAELERQIQLRTQELDTANQLLLTANAQLQEASLRDSLTQLHNRRYVEQLLPSLLARSQRQQEPLTLILLDIDNFKHINDSQGHLMGDLVLQQLARLLLLTARSSDHVIRWGGEEFLVITENNQDASQFAHRLLEQLDAMQWPFIEEAPHPSIAPAGSRPALNETIHQTQISPPSAIKTVTCSIGITQHPWHEIPNWQWDTSLALADKALYLVKQHGKNGWLSLSTTASAPPSLAHWVANAQPIDLVDSPWLERRGTPRILTTIAQKRLSK
jgi:diguanylate cyclase (GGDEF)-like protein